MDKLHDLEGFLKRVDTISGLVAGLRCADADEAQQRAAAERADHYLAALGLEEAAAGSGDGGSSCGGTPPVNRTSINTNPSPCTAAPAATGPPRCSPDVDAANSIKILERDAEERTQRRRTKEEKANELKDKGNEAYARQDYKTAVEFYSDGLAELRDMQPLYTNRAQAYIKLGKYNEAVSDCEWALKCNERCIKAYVHMGKAYIGLRNYKEARNCYEKIVEIEPGREKMAKEYLTQVEWEEERERQELSAREEFDRGGQKASTVPQLLGKLSRPNQSPLYYCGGLELLSLAITDCTGQTLFRLNNGFSVINGNDTLRSCLSHDLRTACAPELHASLLRLCRVICGGNDENQKTLMACPVLSQSIVDLLASEHMAVRRESLSLLCLYSQTHRSRRMAVDNLNVQMLMKNLMKCITNPNDQQEIQALAVLENFASENKFCMQLRDTLTETVLVPFNTILRTSNVTNQHVLSSLISSIGCLVRDDVIRYNMANSPECWEAFVVAMKQYSSSEYRDNVYPLLGLILNISTAVTSPGLQVGQMLSDARDETIPGSFGEHGVPLCTWCLALLSDSHGGIITRATGVLSNVLPQCSAALQLAVDGGVVTAMRRILKGAGPISTKYAMKTITVCTAASHLAREELLKSDKRLSVLRGLLGSSGEEVVLGNAALCLGHCLEVQGAAQDLLPTDAVPLLLRLAAADTHTGRTDVQRNAAIALGKLCRAEPRHMHKLRELHGVEVLHSCMKLIT
ncbi:Tetratricopeptide repeat protein 12 [Merluccius polli]|uniref:Tetratricopeptide repeat protein 12 n=1 Tax=Merluccius polli TaxID=89951 RepID=A0AA47MUX0_MERPO|nr:Tetratricopeptide repeat protein 12 [Merluccius polli]